jgi:hypothetical protein
MPDTWSRHIDPRARLHSWPTRHDEPNCCSDNKEVTAEWIEGRTGRRIANLIKGGRAETRRWAEEARAGLSPGRPADTEPSRGSHQSRP